MRPADALKVTPVPKNVIASFESLPACFTGTSGPPTRYRVKVDRLVRDVVLAGTGCTIEKATGEADTEIHTDKETWLALERGRSPGSRRSPCASSWSRGSIERSLHFEPAFERPRAGALQYSIETVPAGGNKVSALIAGDQDKPPLLLIHGLGATKASWLTVVPSLARITA